MASFPGVLRIEAPAVLRFEDTLDEVADAATPAVVLGDPVGGRTDFRHGIGRTDTQAGKFHCRNVGNVVTHERHLRRLDADPLAEMQQVFRLVLRHHIQMLIDDAQ